MVKKGQLVAYIFLSIAFVFIFLAIIDSQFHTLIGSWWAGIHNLMVVVGDLFRFIFYENLSTFFFWNLIVMGIFTAIYIIAYNITKRRRVGGTITSIFCIIVFLVQFELYIIWGILGLVADPTLTIQTKIIFVIVASPLAFVFFFFMNMLGDIISFWGDVVKERHDYSRLRYHIERNNQIKVIHFDTDATRINTVWSAAIYLLVEEILRKEGDSEAISRFVRSAVTNIIFEIATHFNIWHRFKNMLFRFVGLKLGRDVLVAQYTRVDGLLPNLIYLEDHTALGVSCNLITHTFIDRGDLRAFLYGPIRVCKFARVGANVTITPGITIGEGAVVAAGSLVNKDIPPYTLVGGVPAKKIKDIDPETYRARIEKDFQLLKKDRKQSE